LIPIAEPVIDDEEIQAVVEVLKSRSLREGEKCHQFEKAFAKMVGSKYATAVSSGTAALHTAYTNVIKPGDEVLVPTFTFFATASMVVWAGGIPVFCDIDPQTYCIDLNNAEKRINSKTRAIVPVHLFGNACDIDGILTLAKKYDLRVIWDAAQAHLTKYKGRDVGSYGDAVCYSFYATKNMTTGEGGMITSDDKDFINRCVLFKHQGQSEKYIHSIIGTNYRMTDIEAAIGLAQLNKIEKYTRKRRNNAKILNDNLIDLKYIIVPFVESYVEHSYHQYTILISSGKCINRDKIIEKLKKEEIGAAVHYPMPLHKQPAFMKMIGDISLPVSEKIAETCLSLPVHPFISDLGLKQIIQSIRELDNTFR